MTRMRLIASLAAILGLVWLPGQTVGQLSQIMSKLGFSTIGPEPAILTPAEIEKALIEPPPAAEVLPVPVGQKPPAQVTIEIGPPGLNAVELAKVREIGARAEAAGPQTKDTPSVKAPGKGQ